MSATICGVCGCGNACCTEGRTCRLPEADPVKPLILSGSMTATLVTPDYTSVVSVGPAAVAQAVDEACERLVASATLLDEEYTVYIGGLPFTRRRLGTVSSIYSSPGRFWSIVIDLSDELGFGQGPGTNVTSIRGKISIGVEWTPGGAPCVTLSWAALGIRTIGSQGFSGDNVVSPRVEIEHDAECPTRLGISVAIGMSPIGEGHPWSFASLVANLFVRQPESASCSGGGEVEAECVGRCCIGATNCQNLTQAECAAADGYWDGSGLCAPSACTGLFGTPPNCCSTTGNCAYNITGAQAFGAALFTVQRYMCCVVNSVQVRTECPPVSKLYEWDHTVSAGCVNANTSTPPEDFGAVPDCCPGDTGHVDLPQPDFSASFKCIQISSNPAVYAHAVDIAVGTPFGASYGLRIFTPEPWFDIDVLVSDDQQSLQCPFGVYGPEYTCRVQASVVIEGRASCYSA